jgi:hypothetical protein
VAIARRLDDPFLLTMALAGRYLQCLSFGHGGLDERLRIGAELLALPGKPATAGAVAHMMLTGLAAAALTSPQRSGTPTRPRTSPTATVSLPTVAAAAVSIYRAMRAAVEGNQAAAEFYQQAVAEMDRLGVGRQARYRWVSTVL